MEDDGTQETIQLVTTLRQDALKGLISKESPVGKALLDQGVIAGCAGGLFDNITEAADILRVKVLPLARGNGTVDIVAVGREGKAPGEAAIREAQAVVDRERPVGADARVIAAAETAVNVAASVTLMDGGSLEGVKTAFSQGLTAFFRDNALRTRVVSHGKALRLLLDCAGVADVSGFTMNGSGDSLTLTEGAVPVVGTLALTEVKA